MSMSVQSTNSPQIEKFSPTYQSRKIKSVNVSPHHSANKSFGSADSPGARNLDFETVFQEPFLNCSYRAESIPFIEGRKNEQFTNPTYRTSDRLQLILNGQLSNSAKNKEILNDKAGSQANRGSTSAEYMDSPLSNQKSAYSGQVCTQETPKLKIEGIQTSEVRLAVQVNQEQIRPSIFSIKPQETSQPAHSDNIFQAEGSNLKEAIAYSRAHPQVLDNFKGQLRSSSEKNNALTSPKTKLSSSPFVKESFSSQIGIVTVLRELEPPKASPKNSNKRRKYEYHKPEKKVKPKASNIQEFMSYEEQQRKRAALQKMMQENIHMLCEREAQYKGILSEDLSRIKELGNKIKSIDTQKYLDPKEKGSTRREKRSGRLDRTPEFQKGVVAFSPDSKKKQGNKLSEKIKQEICRRRGIEKIAQENSEIIRFPTPSQKNFKTPGKRLRGSSNSGTTEKEVREVSNNGQTHYQQILNAMQKKLMSDALKGSGQK